MKEEETLNSIFGEKDDFKYCDLCESFYKTCRYCQSSTCSGGNCKDCIDIEIETKLSVTDYLDEEELKIFWKISRLKRLMRESLNRGEKSIDWTKLLEEGRLSERDKEMFSEFLS